MADRLHGFNAYRVERWRELKGGQAFYTERTFQALRANEPETIWEDRRRAARGALEAFGGPVRVILGASDFTDPEAEVWPHVVRRLGDGRLVVLEHAGHVPWLDEPAAFLTALGAALGAATRLLPARLLSAGVGRSIHASKPARLPCGA